MGKTRPSQSRHAAGGAARKGVPQEWQLQDAKARFSELFRLARERGPQRVTKHGREAVVVLASEEYDRLTKSPPRQGTLIEFFANSPFRNAGLRLERQRDVGRTVKL